MKDRFKINDCDPYCENGILKRENLKANSSGRPGTSHDSRSSFFKQNLPPSFLKILRNWQPVVIPVAEPAEIPIFRFPKASLRPWNSYQRAAQMPPFFNST